MCIKILTKTLLYNTIFSTEFPYLGRKTLATGYILFVPRRDAEFMLLRTLIAHLVVLKELHAAHTVSKPETDQLHTQEDLNSSIYAHALINLNSTHNDHNIS